MTDKSRITNDQLHRSTGINPGGRGKLVDEMLFVRLNPLAKNVI